jgi:hypothetical protein
MFSLLLPLLASPALAQDAPVVIWVEDQLPDEGTQRKVQRTLQAEPVHYDGSQLAYPPQPWTEADTKDYAALSRAVERNGARWDEFDVELSMAEELEQALEPVSVIRDGSDRNAVAESLLIQGAALELRFTDEELATDSVLEPLRYELPGLTANAPMIDLIALDPTREFARPDVHTGSGYAELRELQAAVDGMAPAILDTSGVPAGVSLVINGTVYETVPPTLELSPGHAWIHLLRDGVISGRAEVDLYPGKETALPRAVSAEDLAAAGRRVDVKSVEGLPEGVVTAIDDISSQHPGAQVFLASLDPNGKVRVVPYSATAVIPDKQIVTFALGAEVGGGVVGTSAFRWADPDLSNSNTEPIYAPSVQGAFDMELGIYNLALLAGAEVHITPTRKFVLGSSDPNATARDNLHLPVAGRGYGGLGVYILRPTDKQRPVLLLGGTYGWFSPGWHGPGGRLSVGIPMGENSWFKFTFHGSYGVPTPAWVAAGVPAEATVVSGGLRIGFLSAF